MTVWVRLTALAVIAIAALAMSLTPALAQNPAPPTSAQITGLTHYYQTWNNCGGANLTIAMSLYGWGSDQDVARAWLKPNLEDKNISPEQMVSYVNDQAHLGNIRAIWRYGGNLEVIKRAISAGFPVIVESGYDVDNLGWMGHYETVIGYDDASQTIWVHDSYKGPNQAHTYADFEYWWRHFNRAFILLYPQDREADARVALGEYLDPANAALIALNTAIAEASANPTDGWAWFNIGTSHVKMGNYADAAVAFDEALKYGLPYRLMWYMFGPFEAYYYVGRYDDVLTLVENTESTTPYVEETKYWLGMVYAARGQWDLAINEFNKALQFNPNYWPAAAAINQVRSGAFVAPAP